MERFISGLTGPPKTLDASISTRIAAFQTGMAGSLGDVDDVGFHTKHAAVAIIALV